MRLGLVLGLLGLAAWALRWLLQGEAIVWSDIARPFWVADATLGWVETRESWVWLGFDGLVAVGTLVLGTMALCFLQGKLARALTRIGAAIAMLAPVLPVWAFLSGFPPEGAERLLPTAAASQSAAGRAALAAGSWRVAQTADDLLVARITAGGESFDARFTPLSGELVIAGAPPSARAELRVPAASIATGVELRDTHAKKYLEVERHPIISLEIQQVAPTTGAFAAEAVLHLMGRSIPVTLQGTLAPFDGPGMLLANASFSVPIAATPLDPDNFDAAVIDVTARFVLVPNNGSLSDPIRR